MGDHSFNILSICTGAGGLELGVRLAIPASGVVCYVEREGFAIEHLASRMEEGLLDEAPVWTDLRTFDGRPWSGVVDIVTAGYPCQPFSTAGQRRGGKDPRHLWPEVLRTLGETKAPILFVENVYGHLSSGFDLVAADLLRMGLKVEAGLFSAEEVGLPHGRTRLFILACRPGAEQNLAREVAQHLPHMEPVGKGCPPMDPKLETLADAWNPQRRQMAGPGNRPRPRIRNGQRTAAGSSGNALPPFLAHPQGAEGLPVLSPPRPNQFDLWDEILSQEPRLEPSVRRLDDGMAPWLGNAGADVVDCARLVGNGVVPATAAFALSVLALRLAS